MSQTLPLPPVQAYQPATFQERGVAVPFTSPLLAGARVRRGERVRVELVVPNPSGGRGVYILPWSSVRILFRPSVHDNRLYKRISTQDEIAPETVRQAGLDMACQGLAGRQAMAAALRARKKDADEQLLTMFLLLVSLAEQADPAGLPKPQRASFLSLELERRARQVVVRIAPEFGCSEQQIMQALSDMTRLFGPVGVAVQSTQARVPRMVEALTEVQAELLQWAQDHAEDVHVDLADMIADYAEMATTATTTTLARVWAMTRDMAGLLRLWNKSPERVIDLVGRPGWLFDGWEQVCLLWRSSTTAEQRRAVLTEMAQLVPVLPREFADWVKMPATSDDDRAGTEISLNKDWRTGVAVLRLTARNERMRASVI